MPHTSLRKHKILCLLHSLFTSTPSIGGHCLATFVCLKCKDKSYSRARIEHVMKCRPSSGQQLAMFVVQQCENIVYPCSCEVQHQRHIYVLLSFFWLHLRMNRLAVMAHSAIISMCHTHQYTCTYVHKCTDTHACT